MGSGWRDRIPEGLPPGLQQRQPELHHAVWRRLAPNFVPGCSKGAPAGGTSNKINEWFNTGCFVSPADFTFGNESRTDANLRGSGVNNFDFALFKRTQFGPDNRLGLEFRTEFFNLFNRTQFAPPNTSVGSANFGVVTSTAAGTTPRLIQFGLKFIF